jgi:hypothetical protein
MEKKDKRTLYYIPLEGAQSILGIGDVRSFMNSPTSDKK